MTQQTLADARPAPTQAPASRRPTVIAAGHCLPLS